LGDVISVGVSSLPGERVAYVAAHTALLYERASHTQTALQGHANAISCLATSAQKTMLATADAGPGAMVILWNANTGEPVRTIPLGESTNGALCVDFAPDGASLAVLTAADGDGLSQNQEVLIYDLKAPANAPPVCATEVPPGDMQTCLRFPTNRNTELVSNGKQRTFFWTPSPSTGSLAFHSPPVRSRDFKQALGAFTQSAFIPRSTAAATGTSDGDIVLWEEGLLAEPGARASDRRATKVLRIHSAAVTTLVAHGRYLVSGGEDGFVRFFDNKLKLNAWFEEIDAGPVMAISFDARGGGAAAEDEVDGEDAPRMGPDNFVAPDMVVATGNGRVIAIRADSFDLPSGSPAKRGVTWLEGTVANATAIAVHPSRYELLIVSSTGSLQVWDYARRRLMTTMAKEKCAGSCVAYTPDGSLVAVGCSTGHLRLLTAPPSLSDVESFRFTTSPITHVEFSPDGKMVAVADARHTVALVSHGHGKSGERWELVGKYNAHATKVLKVLFSSNGAVLTSLDAEGVLASFDARESTPQSGLRLLHHGGMTHVDASPTAFTMLPSTSVSGAKGEPVIVAADANLKLKTYELNQFSCVATALGPAYGGAVEHLTPLSREALGANESLKVLGKDVLCYACSERAAGLCLYPHTGDPKASLALVVHPGGISACLPTPDARKLITLGDDGIVNLWTISVDALAAPLVADESEAVATERTLDALIEGGSTGEMLSEARDYFYYAQLRAQGEETTEPRLTPGVVVASDVPDMLCAMGYYPSEAEVQDLLAECQAEDMNASADVEGSSVTFAKMMLLLANHRPLKGVDRADIEAAFRTLGADSETGTLSKSQLVEALISYGEYMSEDELNGCLGALYGAGASADALPEEIDARYFAEGVLGFEDLGS